MAMSPGARSLMVELYCLVSPGGFWGPQGGTASEEAPGLAAKAHQPPSPLTEILWTRAYSTSRYPWKRIDKDMSPSNTVHMPSH